MFLSRGKYGITSRLFLKDPMVTTQLVRQNDNRISANLREILFYKGGMEEFIYAVQKVIILKIRMEGIKCLI